MYYRRKLLLAVVEKSPNRRAEKIVFQKLLFLINRAQFAACYDFVPYKFGAFSFQSNKDMTVLANHYNIIAESEKHWQLNVDGGYFADLKKQDKAIIKSVLAKYQIKSADNIIADVYDKFPYYTIHSVRQLNPQQKESKKRELAKIKRQSTRQLLTLGYEGLSIDAYLNKLISSNVSLLCDVRKNPLSMKYGFSKSQLSGYCENLGIKYAHIPGLGIDSGERKHLKSMSDYRDLFAKYRKSLPGKKETVRQIKDLLDAHTRVALTCFEKEHECCHRSTLADYFQTTFYNQKVIHL